MPNYDIIAWIYDFLVKVVFGVKQDKANKAFIGKISSHSKVLIVGGGTGRIINDLNDLNRPIIVDYVDISDKMIMRAKSRKNTTLDITFYHKSILEFDKSGYDYIITNFFFDQFTWSVGHEIASHLYLKLKNDGRLIFSDFIPTKSYLDKMIIASSYLFLRITANLETKTLPDYNLLFSKANFFQGETVEIGRNIIASLWYPYKNN